MSDDGIVTEPGTEGQEPPRVAASSHQERRQLQLLFVAGMCLAVGMLLPFAWDHRGSMAAVDWLRMILGIGGLGVAGASAVLQTRRP